MRPYIVYDQRSLEVRGGVAIATPRTTATTAATCRARRRGRRASSTATAAPDAVAAATKPMAIGEWRGASATSRTAKKPAVPSARKGAVRAIRPRTASAGARVMAAPWLHHAPIRGPIVSCPASSRPAVTRRARSTGAGADGLEAPAAPVHQHDGVDVAHRVRLREAARVTRRVEAPEVLTRGRVGHDVSERLAVA